jgi:hypothetical protein
MFGLEYVLAFIKIMTNIGFSIVTAIPLYFSWNCIAPKYLVSYIPSQFLVIPYWHVVGFLLVSLYIGEMINHLTPKIFYFNSGGK